MGIIIEIISQRGIWDHCKQILYAHGPTFTFFRLLELNLTSLNPIYFYIIHQNKNPVPKGLIRTHVQINLFLVTENFWGSWLRKREARVPVNTKKKSPPYKRNMPSVYYVDADILTNVFRTAEARRSHRAGPANFLLKRFGNSPRQNREVP